MRIRKHFPSSSSSLSSLPLSDPQLISRSPSLVVVVQPQYSNHHHLNNNDSNNNNLHEEPKRRINPDHRLSSDPHHQPLIHHNHTAATSQQTAIIGTENPALVVCARNNSNIDQQQLEHKEIIKDERWKTEEEMKISNDNDIRKDISSIAEVDVQFPQSSSSSSSCQDKWGEGDRIVPPKKRKGSFVRTMGTTSKEMIKPKMKSKTNKKCLQQNSDQRKETHYKDGADTSTSTVAVDTKNTTKKSKRGSVIMEGSRCSRVNGRGWRCCQQTLVGYSLCEHHLGKGRLRSMTSVRNRASNIAMARRNIMTSSTPTSSSTAAAQQQQNDHSQTPQKQEIIVTTKSSPTWKTCDDDDDDDDDYKNNNNIINIVAPEEEDEMKNPLYRISRKKRKIMKIGSVKARSISSLLGLTDTAGAGAGAANRNKDSTG